MKLKKPAISKGRRKRQKQKMEEQLLTLEDVATYLRIDRYTIYRLLAQKKLPAFKVGHQWRFQKRMIDAWLMKNVNFPKGTPALKQDYGG